MPFDSLLAAVQGGKIDAVVAAMNYSEERDEMVDFTIPYLESATVFVVTDDFAGSLETVDDVAGLILGAQNGATADTWITETLIDAGLMAEEDLFRYDRVDQGVLDLEAGRIDAFAVDNTPAETIAAQKGGLQVLYLSEDLIPLEPMNIVVPEGDSEFVDALNEVLAEMKAEGLIQELEMTWIYAE